MNCVKCGKEIPAGQEVKKGSSYEEELPQRLQLSKNIERATSALLNLTNLLHFFLEAPLGSMNAKKAFSPPL